MTQAQAQARLLASPLDTGIWRSPDLEALLGQRPRPAWRMPAAGEAVIWVGWGNKRSGRRARRLAGRTQTGCWLLEDGFVRSVGLGATDAPLSVIADDIGVYYDARRPSRLERLAQQPLDDAQTRRAQALRQAWCAQRVSKYNHQRDVAAQALPESYVLVVDQTRGDASIPSGLADADSFQRMLDAALQENPGQPVVVKTHPEVFAGTKRGHFDLERVRKQPRVRVLGTDVHPAGLIERASQVYAVTSQMGFEALLWGRPVRCFGMPFYAGWGLTRDELPPPARRHPVTLPQLIHAALIEYPRYIDPETGQRCEVERLIAWMGLQRRQRESLPADIHAWGFSRWKKPIVRDYLQGSRAHFVRSPAATPDGGILLVWGAKRVAPEVRARVLRVEDGFLRSVGLGADLIRPISWVIDDEGIYFDATRPSRLERLLRETDFDAGLLARAAALRERLVASRLTKYNVGARAWARPAGAARVILVPGQVESDASLACGAPAIRTNAALLAAVRAANPQALLVYKPHPDVAAGLRQRETGPPPRAADCDVWLEDVPMATLLEAVDEVHTMTSLSGFEALIRGKNVVCYGLPFYAGWGLTTDIIPPTDGRRGRQLPLDALVAAALILYPRYLSRRSGRFVEAETALAQLLAWRAAGGGAMPWWRRGLRKLLGLAARLRGR
jgi:capsular polysaccharide export protein